MNITTIGIDLAKNVIQVHGVERSGKVVLKKGIQARASAGRLCQIIPITDRYGRLWQRPLMGQKVARVRPHGEADGAAVRQTLG